MKWPRRRWEVWSIWKDDHGHVVSERSIKRCWTCFGAQAEVGERQNSTAAGAFIAGSALAGRPYSVAYEIRDNKHGRHAQKERERNG